MPISLSHLRQCMNVDAWRQWQARWDAMTPEQQKAHEARAEARRERAREHIAFLDYCVAKKIDPNLVRVITEKD